MDEGTGILPGLPAVAGKPVHLTFDGGLMTSDAGVLLLAATERRLGISERLRELAPRTSFWRDAQFDTIRLCLIKVAGRVTEMVTRIKVALPTAYPYQPGFADLAGRIATLPP